MIRILPLIVILGFLLELVSIIAVGRHIGVIATILLIIAGFAAGGAVIRSAGVNLAVAMRRPMVGTFATSEATSGFLYLLAGLLLILPGFLSDIAALLLLMAPLRRWLAFKLARYFFRFFSDDRSNFQTDPWPPPRRGDGPVIEGEVVEIEGEIEGRK